LTLYINKQLSLPAVKHKEINYQSFKEGSLPWSTELLISAEEKKAQ
jgi:hypothetical protein